MSDKILKNPLSAPALYEKLERERAQNQRLIEALTKIRNLDWGTDHCDAKNMIADEVLNEIKEIGSERSNRNISNDRDTSKEKGTDYN